MSSLTQRATVTANLLRMGFSAAEAERHGRAWAETQALFSLHRLRESGLYDCPIVETGMDVELGGSFVVSAHFGSMPHVILAVGRRAKNRKVYALVGDEPAALTGPLRDCARAHDIELEFIDGGFGMVRQVLRVLRAGHPIFVAPDVPWGLDRDCALRLPFVGGLLKAKDTVYKLIERCGAPSHYVLGYGSAAQVEVVNHGRLDQHQALQVLADAVRRHPHMYERLFQVHHYFDPAAVADDAVLWRVEEQDYVLHARDMKAWQLRRGQAVAAAGAALGAQLASVLGRPVRHVVSI